MRRQKARPPPSAKSLIVPVPMGSINTIAAGVGMPEDDCVSRTNLIPAEYGNRVRLGWREWVTGLDGEPRTFMPFTGSTSSGNRIFAATSTGIWDVTSSSAAPTQVLAFGTVNADSGWGISTVMTTAAGHFLLYWDEANGYHVYTETGATWAVGGLAGNPVTAAGGSSPATVLPANLVSGLVWKNRLWMVERDTGRAWYLPVNAVTGEAKPFNFGARFKAGGDLRGLFAWTYDGGGGIDDALVAVSGGGDVLIYLGTDPDTAGAFGIKGVWFVGGVPSGRRIASDFGGDLLVMTTAGILSLSQLVVGHQLGDQKQYSTVKIASLWNKLQISSANLRGWAVVMHPKDATALVISPTGDGLPSRILASSTTTQVWSEYTDMGMGIAAATHEGSLYYGTPEGAVRIADGYVDGVTLADPNSYAAIPFSMLTAFQALGSANQKQIQLIEPAFLCEGGAPPFAVEARYRMDLSDVGTSPSDASPPGAALWDQALWDQANWAPEFTASNQVRGVTGIGPEVAIAIRGTAAARTVLTGFRVVYTEGGLF